MKNQSILVVDDELIIRSSLSEVLRSFGYLCQTAADGIEAIELVQEYEFEVIISDICMPNMSGFDLMLKTRKIKPEIPFILTTGYIHEYTLDKIIDAGASELITKPFKIDELKFKLERVVRERDLHIENKRLLREQGVLNEKLAAILNMSRNLNADMSFDRLLELIVKETTAIMEAERTSLYLIDWEKKELWTKIAQGIDEIHIPVGEGISGRVAESGVKINVVNAWDLPYFNREYDRKNNFMTRSVLCVPVYNRTKERIGILQVINKKGKGRFNRSDEIILDAIASQVAVTLENHSLINELQISFESSIRTLSATVDARHPLTAGHSQRVTEYSLILGRKLELNNEELEVIKYAALLHDIGKIGIRDNVLLKQGTFTSEERAEMNEHPQRTRDILENFHFPSALRSVPVIASQHHEKVNGEGYPFRLIGENLPLSSKILAVSDVFDALTSPRDYPKYDGEKIMNNDSMPLATAVKILKEGAGNHFDPNVVECFIKCMPEIIEFHRGTHFSEEYIEEYLKTI